MYIIRGDTCVYFVHFIYVYPEQIEFNLNEWNAFCDVALRNFH